MTALQLRSVTCLHELPVLPIESINNVSHGSPCHMINMCRDSLYWSVKLNLVNCLIELHKYNCKVSTHFIISFYETVGVWNLKIQKMKLLIELEPWPCNLCTSVRQMRQSTKINFANQTLAKLAINLPGWASHSNFKLKTPTESLGSSTLQ